MELKQFIDEEVVHLHKLAELVQQSIKEEELLSARLLELEQDAEMSFGQRLADSVAEFGGSWTFISVFFAILLGWIILNTVILSAQSFDPYPFILLNLVLSCIAAIQAPIIMMSQNRREDKDRRRARGDFMVNMKAEIEVRSLHSKVDLLMAEQMGTLFKVQESQLEMLQKIQSLIEEKMKNNG